MSHSRPSPSPQPESQPTFTAPPADPALRCPICGSGVVTSWWVADLMLCENCYWSGRTAACKVIGGGNVLHAEGES